MGGLTVPPELMSVLKTSAVELSKFVRLTDIILSSERKVSGIVYDDGQSSHKEDFEGVFLAPPIEPKWEQIASQFVSRRSVDKGTLIVSGMVNSIDYNAYAALSGWGARREGDSGHTDSGHTLEISGASVCTVCPVLCRNFALR